MELVKIISLNSYIPTTMKIIFKPSRKQWFWIVVSSVLRSLFERKIHIFMKQYLMTTRSLQYTTELALR